MSRQHIHNDPAEWNIASFNQHPVDAIEPMQTVSSEYRQCALLFKDQIDAIDEWMCLTHTGRPPRKWIPVSIIYKLRSTWGQTETEVARLYGVTRAAISKDVVAVLKFTKLEDNPGWGLKSAENRETYRRTNGRRRKE